MKTYKQFIEHYRIMKRDHKGFTMFRFYGWHKIHNFFYATLRCFILGHKELGLPTRSMRSKEENANSFQFVCTRCSKNLRWTDRFWN